MCALCVCVGVQGQGGSGGAEGEGQNALGDAIRSVAQAGESVKGQKVFGSWRS